MFLGTLLNPVVKFGYDILVQIDFYEETDSYSPKSATYQIMLRTWFSWVRL